MTTPNTAAVAAAFSVATAPYQLRLVDGAAEKPFSEQVEFVYTRDGVAEPHLFRGFSAINDLGRNLIVNLSTPDGSLVDGPTFRSKQDARYGELKALVLTMPGGGEQWGFLGADSNLEDAPVPDEAPPEPEPSPAPGVFGTDPGDAPVAGRDYPAQPGEVLRTRDANGRVITPPESGSLAAHLVAEVRQLVDWLAREEGNMQHEAYAKLQHILHHETHP